MTGNEDTAHWKCEEGGRDGGVSFHTHTIDTVLRRKTRDRRATCCHVVHTCAHASDTHTVHTETIQRGIIEKPYNLDGYTHKKKQYQDQ